MSQFEQVKEVKNAQGVSAGAESLSVQAQALLRDYSSINNSSKGGCSLPELTISGAGTSKCGGLMTQEQGALTNRSRLEAEQTAAGKIARDGGLKDWALGDNSDNKKVPNQDGGLKDPYANRDGDGHDNDNGKLLGKEDAFGEKDGVRNGDKFDDNNDPREGLKDDKTGKEFEPSKKTDPREKSNDSLDKHEGHDEQGCSVDPDEQERGDARDERDGEEDGEHEDDAERGGEEDGDAERLYDARSQANMTVARTAGANLVAPQTVSSRPTAANL